VGEGEGHEAAEPSARDELRALVGAARAWLELHRDVGTFGLPAGEAFAASPDGPDEGRPLASVVTFSPPPDAPAGPHPRSPSAPAVRGAAPVARGPYAPAPGAPDVDPGPPPEPHAGRDAAFDAAPSPSAPPGTPPAGDAVIAASRAAPPTPPAASQSGLFSLAADGRPLRPGVALGVEVPPDPEARLVRLQVLAGEAEGCARCRLHAGRTKSVFARGNPRARIMFVGEGPGADEDVQGLPFVGKAGQLLDKMIAAMGLRQNEIYIANVVKCRPPQNRKPEPDEMSACVPYLAEQIALLDPEVIIALGGTAAEGLLGGRVAITRARGQWRLYRATIPVMPTYHPAYLLRNPPAKREVWDDLRAVLQRLGRGIPGKGA
jgi:DNA polymerase